MRRLQAILLLVAFSFPLVSLPLVSLGTSGEEKLPSCCRRDGKHRCSMKGMAGSGAGLSGLRAKCPVYPNGQASPALTAFDVPIPTLAGEAPVHGLAVLIEQTEARYRISYSRAGQKRGPPSFLLS